MALSNLPTIWSAQALTALRANLVYAGLANRDYEGQISELGDTVKIRGISDPSVADYTRNSDIPAVETLSDSQTNLIIDQAKVVNFQVDDLDQLQKVGGRSIKLESTQNAGRKFAEASDAVVAASYVAGAGITTGLGSSGTPIQIDVPDPGLAPAAGSLSVYKFLAKLEVKLNKANVPLDGRWVVVPSFMAGGLTQDARFVQAKGASLLDTGLPADVNGFIGNVLSFRVFTTSVVPTVATGKYQVLAGYRGTATYADQLTKMEFYRPERRFADAVKGIHVFGTKVIRANTLAMAIVQDVSGLDA